MSPDDIARVAHEVNRAYCIAIGDDSQGPWSEAPQWQRDSAISGVLAHLVNPHTPEESHQLWSAEKVRDGWKYGAVKDADKKEHPCLVSYDQLPLEQRVKDYLFGAVVASLRDEGAHTK